MQYGQYRKNSRKTKEQLGGTSASSSAGSSHLKWISSSENSEKNRGMMDNKITYVTPVIEDRRGPCQPRKEREIKPKPIRIPSRLENPILPYSETVAPYFNDMDESVLEDFFDSDYQSLRALRNVVEESYVSSGCERIEVTCEVNILKQLLGAKFSVRSNRMEETARAFASRATSVEMTEAMMEEAKVTEDRRYNSPCLGLIIFFQRLRTGICMNSPLRSTEEGELSVWKIGEELVVGSCAKEGMELVYYQHGNHFYIWHENMEKAFVGPLVFLEYIYTVADILDNMSVMASMSEYKAQWPIMEVIMKYGQRADDHKRIVEFFKSYEAFCLYLADIKSSDTINWEPVLDCMDTMIGLSEELSGYRMSRNDVFKECDGLTLPSRDRGIMSEVCRALSKLTSLELLEVSALHKSVFYAIGNPRAGIEKVLRRTHTERDVDPAYMVDLLGVTKKEFIIEFSKREKVCPSIIGPEAKKAVIMSSQKAGQISMLEGYPAAWWSDIIVFGCLEKMSPEHPVEFAKDKGALKEYVQFGPMDNLRELTQVMSDPDYKADEILDEIDTGEIKCEILNVRSLKDAIKVFCPCRWCEKGGEQKWEQRMFGVATARFKHGLSELMKMCKAFLSYYSGSYMTMTEKGRRDHLHDTSQMLLEDDVFSVMLDIEGHNQSMQPRNTECILEFIGQCYGMHGLGKLSHLFKNIHFYHYNAYKNDVIISRGQLGGVEGWFNPVWTLVTLQQMKLLKERTGLNVTRVAGYSDDVQILIRMRDQSQGSISGCLKVISDDVLKGGFLMKPSQSAVSGRRATMLRVHTIDGRRADSTLKRLLAVTTCGSSKLVSDELEVDGISSTVSSALEGSYHIKTATFLKWYKLALLSLRSFASIFSRRREETLISPESLPPKVRSMLYYESLHSDDLDFLQSEELKAHMASKASGLIRELGIEGATIIVKDWLATLRNSNAEEVRMTNNSDSVIYLVGEDQFMMDFFMY
jgi:hypothetical protein